MASLASVRSQAQLDTVTLSFRHLTIEDGLSQGMISAIVQDRQGFLWFATKDGLDRYDGYDFKVYRHDPLDSSSLVDSHILALLEDRQGRLWVGTNKGLDLFDPSTENFHHVPCLDGNGAAEGSLRGCAIDELVEDPLGRIWVATEHAFCRIAVTDTTLGKPMVIETILPHRVFGAVIDDAGILHAMHDERGERRLFSIDTRDPAQRGEVIRATGAYTDDATNTGAASPSDLTLCVDTARDELYGVHAGGILALARPQEASRSVTEQAWGGMACAAVDAAGRIWSSTMTSLYRTDPVTGRASHIVPFDHEQLTAVANVHRLYRDRSGVFWLGTKGHGVLSYDPRGERFHPQRSATMRWMLPLQDGKVLMIRGRWAYAYDPVSHQSAPAFSTTTAGFLNDQKGREPSLVQDSTGAMWINDQGALIRYDARDGSTQRFTPLSDRVEFPLHLHDDRVISFAGEDALGSFDLRSHSFSTHPYPIPAEGGVYLFLQTIHQDPEGVIWLGTMKGLLRFDPRTEKWRHYASITGDPRSLAMNVIFCLLDDPRDPRNVLWVGTNGGGLDRLDKRTGEFTHFGQREGLPNEVIYGLLADADGQLWMSTNKGIARFDPETRTVRSFDASDGLQGDEFNRYSYCKLADGTLFFGGVDGFSHFHPRDLKDDERPVQVQITDLKLMNRSIPFGSPGSPLQLPPRLVRELVLPYREDNMLTIEFASMDHGSVRNRQYQYQLEGFDAERIPVGHARSATYTHLDPGEYHFKLWGRNHDGVWNADPLTLRVLVVPPWYLRTWARVLGALLVIAGIAGYVRLHTRSIRRERDELRKMVSLRRTGPDTPHGGS